MGFKCSGAGVDAVGGSWGRGAKERPKVPEVWAPNLTAPEDTELEFRDDVVSIHLPHHFLIHYPSVIQLSLHTATHHPAMGLSTPPTGRERLALVKPNVLLKELPFSYLIRSSQLFATV